MLLPGNAGGWAGQSRGHYVWADSSIRLMDIHFYGGLFLSISVYKTNSLIPAVNESLKEIEG
jgi:hypothetical protein